MEDGFHFEWPGFLDRLPRAMGADDARRFQKVRLEIRAEIKRSAAFRPGGDRIEKRRLDEAVFVMPTLGPRIRKQNENGREVFFGGERGEEFVRFREQEKKIRQSLTVSLPRRTFDPVANDVDAHANPFGMCSGICGEKMAMTASDLQEEGLARREKSAKRFAEFRGALARPPQVSRGAKRAGGCSCFPEFRLHRWQPRRSSLPPCPSRLQCEP